MTVNLFRIWLPLSLGLHLLLLPALQYASLAAHPKAQETAYHLIRLDAPAPTPSRRPLPRTPRIKQPAKTPPAVLKVKPQQAAVAVKPTTPATVNPRTPDPAPGPLTRPSELASPGTPKESVSLTPKMSDMQPRALAPVDGPLRAPPLSGGGAGSLDFAPTPTPAPIGPVVTSTRGSFAVPTGTIGGLHRAPVEPDRIGGPGIGRGISGIGGDDTPAVPNLGRVQTPVPGAAAPGALPASVFRPGLPAGLPEGDAWASAPGADPKLPMGLPGGTPGGRGAAVADPSLPIGKIPGGGYGTGRGLPAHGPIALRGPEIGYPALAAKEGMSGTVVVVVAVTPEGTVAKAEVEKRTISDTLDNAAVRSARQWLFRPAGDDQGRPTSSTARMQFVFADGKVVVTQL